MSSILRGIAEKKFLNTRVEGMEGQKPLLLPVKATRRKKKKKKKKNSMDSSILLNGFM